MGRRDDLLGAFGDAAILSPFLTGFNWGKPGNSDFTAPRPEKLQLRLKSNEAANPVILSEAEGAVEESVHSGKKRSALVLLPGGLAGQVFCVGRQFIKKSLNFPAGWGMGCDF